MKRLLLLTVLLFALSGCSPPTAQFIRDQEMAPVEYLDIGPTAEVEDRLTRAFAEQVDWDNYDAEVIVKGISTIKAEFEWLSVKAQSQGNLSFYDVTVANEKVEYFWVKVKNEVDQIVTNGEVDSDTSLIYYYVRRDIEKALMAWRQSVKAAEASIDAKIGKYDVDQIKQAFEMLQPFFATVLI